jgi:NADPH-dependent glutamate synthase beta subunit-like oxidoreductase
VWVGQTEKRRGSAHVSLQQLREKYSAVILSYGALSDHPLNLDGEFTTSNVLPSRHIVDWYNGSLDDNLHDVLDLHDKQHMAIIGNGNVACDVARIMLKKQDELG